MSGPDDTPEVDAAAEWSPDSAPTVLDGAPLAEAVPEEFSDQVTRTNDLGPVLDQARDKGFVRGFSAGQEDALGALRSLLLERGSSNEEAAHVVMAVRLRLMNP